MSYRGFILESLHEASDIARAQFGHVTGKTKGKDNNQVLTETDLAIGRLFIAKAQQYYPDYNIIDEEAGVIDNGSEYTLVFDPIDGTSNFSNGVVTYGLMMGLLKGDVPIAGGIALPGLDQIYTAEKGQSTELNGQKVKVSEASNLLSVLIAYGIDGHQEDPELTYNETRILAELILKIRNLRTTNSAFDMTMTIRGGFGGFLNRTSKIWDNVAPHILVEEAGGLYTDFWGQPMDYSQPLTKANQNFTMCAAAPALHQQLQTIVQPFKDLHV